MSTQHVAAGGAVGLALTALILVALRKLSSIIAPLRFEEVGRARWMMFWLILFGVALALVVVTMRSNPLVSGVPAVLLFLVYLPLFGNLTLLSWYPDWLNKTILASAGPAPLVIIGFLAGMAGWIIGRQVRPKH